MSTPGPDDALLDRLRQLAREADPVPPLVVAAARVSFELRSLDAKLAELVADSADERADPALVRAAADVRLLSFAVGQVWVELEVTVEDGLRRLVGELSGGRDLELETSNARVPVPVDELGRFSADGVAAGRCRLHISGDDGPVTTSWVTI